MNTSPTILVSLPPDEIAFSRIREACPGCEIRVAPCPCSIEEKGQEMEVDLMRGADLLLCEVPPDNFGEFDQLKFMQLTSAGYEHILHLPLVEKGIRVSNGLGNFDGPIAE